MNALDLLFDNRYCQGCDRDRALTDFRTKRAKYCDECRKERYYAPKNNWIGYKEGKLRRTPIWLTTKQKQQIKQFYKNCPDDHHVDHIIPLKGTTISGLHVPWNLQYLPAIENLRKNNRFPYV